MISLTFGLMAALCWGLHDFVVRDVARKAPALPLLALVLGFGAVLLGPLTLIDGWGGMTPRAMGIAALSGGVYVLGCFGLYRAFAIGPVGLVSPICGAYPLVTLLLAMAAGREIGGREWFAVALVVGGIALVAGHREPGQGARLAAILWATLGATGFALTFQLGQIAAREGGDLAVTLVARLVALMLVLAVLSVQRQRLAPALPHWRPLSLMGALDMGALSLVLASGSLPRPEYAAVASSLFGVVTILLAWRFLNERLGRVQALGVAVVFAGIALLAAG
ncbi:MAG: DMT family transporter [Gemmobacter sp.]|jgi:drug/metabolite transporter (DMT)-like permease|nr:DMT family transporter [Gemmobacter sp.]